MTLRPRPWSTGDVGSFAHRTLAVRVPRILEDTVAHNVAAANAAFTDEVKAACAALHQELTCGVLRPLRDDATAGHAADRAAWDAACAPHVGKSWLDLPWYFAESFFYRRLLEAVGYFRPGPGFGRDPFLVVKQAEEAHMLPRLQAAQASPLPLEALLHLSLWGNRADLSYTAGRAFGEVGDAADLLVDDTVAAAARLRGARRAAFLLDNAGTELAFDLLLADALAAFGLEVELFAKDHPFFVSDATAVDVERTRRLLATPPLPVWSHPFMTSSGFLFQDEMPADLVAALAGFDVVIAKGDANYRRLVGDAPWPHATPVAEAMDFPAPVLALRTLKSEVAVGLDDEAVGRARARDPDWLVDGRFGLVQLCGPA